MKPTSRKGVGGVQCKQSIRPHCQRRRGHAVPVFAPTLRPAFLSRPPHAGRWCATMKRFLSTFAVLTLFSALAGCNATSGDRGDRPLRVVTTTGMITDIVQTVGGEHVEVTGLM